MEIARHKYQPQGNFWLCCLKIYCFLDILLLFVLVFFIVVTITDILNLMGFLKKIRPLNLIDSIVLIIKTNCTKILIIAKMKKIKRNLDCNKAFKIHIAKNLNEFKLEATKNHLKLENSLENLTDGSKNLILKEEMNEKHLQEAINHKSAIPVPDIVEIEAADYDKLYPPDCVIPKIRIMIQRESFNAHVLQWCLLINLFLAKNEVIEYDADSEDDEWLKQDAEALKLTYDNFEKYMEYLENALALTKVI